MADKTQSDVASIEAAVHVQMEEENAGEETLEAVNRLAKLPVVEGTLHMASNLYEKVKDASPVLGAVISTAEKGVSSAVETAKPVTNKLKGPLKRMDTLVCSGLDIVEDKAAAILSEPEPSSENENASAIESVHRLAKLPMIESTLNIASNLYGKVKDASPVLGAVISTAEKGVTTAVETAKPVASKLKGPIKRVDSLVCSGLDIVEDKVPAVKMAPSELVASTKHLVASAGQTALEKAHYGANKLGELAAAGADKMAAVAATSTTASGEREKTPVPVVAVTATGDSAIDSVFRGECQKCTTLALEAINGQL